jgi:hypothetical protein
MLAKRAEKADRDSPGAMALLSLPPNTGPVPIRGDYKYTLLPPPYAFLYPLFSSFPLFNP